MTPVMGSKGIFKFKSPYDLLTEDLILEVIAIRTFNDIESEGINVLETIYKKEKLTEEDFKRDKSNNVYIVVFQGTSNQFFRIPSSYILDVPVTDGVFFKEIVLSAPIGYIPLDYDVSSTLREVENTILKGLGVMTECVEIEAGKRVVMTENEVTEFNQRISVNRAGRNHVDYESRIRELESQNEQLKKANKALMDVFNSANADPSNPIQIPQLGPSIADKRIMAKRIELQVLGNKGEFTLSNLTFYKYLYEGSKDPDYNRPLVPFRFSISDDIYGFKIGTSEMISGKMELADGDRYSVLDGFSDLPAIFSKNDFAKFRPGLVKINFIFEKPILIRGVTFMAQVGTMKAERYKINIYNDKDQCHATRIDVVPDQALSGATRIEFQDDPILDAEGDLT